MRTVSIETIRAAKGWDPEAVGAIRKHFEGFILSQCQMTYTDDSGKHHSYIDEDLRYQAELAMFRALESFQFQEPSGE